MLVMRTTEDPANPIGEFVGAQQALGLYNLALAVDPFGFDRVEPRTLLWQQAAYDPNSGFSSTAFDLTVVRTEPAPDLLGDVPTCVVPDKEQDLLAKCFELLAAPRKELGRYAAHGPPIHEPQPRIAELLQIDSVAGDGLRLGIVFSDRLLNEMHRLALLSPATEGGQSEPAPPAFVLESDGPFVAGHSHLHQSVAAPFFFRTRDLGRLSIAWLAANALLEGAQALPGWSPRRPAFRRVPPRNSLPPPALASR